MAIYHLSMKPIGRTSGRSAVAALAHRAGECFANGRAGLTHDFRLWCKRFIEMPALEKIIDARRRRNPIASEIPFPDCASATRFATEPTRAGRGA